MLPPICNSTSTAQPQASGAPLVVRVVRSALLDPTYARSVLLVASLLDLLHSSSSPYLDPLYASPSLVDLLLSSSSSLDLLVRRRSICSFVVTNSGFAPVIISAPLVFVALFDVAVVLFDATAALLNVNVVFFIITVSQNISENLKI